MILAIDVGNTNIVLGMIENGEIQNVVRIHTDLRETGTEYALKLRQVADFYHIDLMGLEGAIISSVVPPVTESLRLAVESLIGKKPLIVAPGMKTGMNVRIDDPSTMAGDLVVGSVVGLVEPCAQREVAYAGQMEPRAAHSHRHGHRDDDGAYR